MFKKISVGIVAVFALISCGGNNNESDSATTPDTVPVGKWRGELDLKQEETLKLPFEFTFERINGQLEMTLINGVEELSGNKVVEKGDSLLVELAIFDGKISLQRKGNHVKGYFHNFSKGPDYKLPMEGEYGKNHRVSETYYGKKFDFSGKWETKFSKGKNAYPAIGNFSQMGDKITGTFLTETGDFRFLEGQVKDSTLVMTAFDGSHAFYFDGTLKGDTIEGRFHSGSHYATTWKAVRNDSFMLPDPYKLTYLNEGYDGISFDFPGLENDKMVSLKDKKYQNQVVLVQIMGSWCPNCMDECAYFNELYKKYHDRGLEIVGIAFESSKDLDEARKSLRKLVDYYQLPYDFAIGGYASKKVSSEVFPMLNAVMSYPTSILLDRTGKVVQIHTGFSGPSTGEVFEEYKTRMEQNIENIL